MNLKGQKNSALRLIVDSGSTKTDWCVTAGGKLLLRLPTQGINPFHQTEDEILGIVNNELLPCLGTSLGREGSRVEDIMSVNFYGAGCRGEAISKVQSILSQTFPHTDNIIVGSDLLAAAHAVCGKSEGIACILGTGANSCLFDGTDIIANVSPLGYILGDEGSGAVLGKLFINGIFKGNIPNAVKEEFLQTTCQTPDDIIRKVYREPMANRYLASLSPFIHSHLNCPEVAQLVTGNFEDFFRLNVDHYKRHDLRVGAVGSVAYYYKEQFAEAARRSGYTVGKIVKNPMDELLKNCQEQQTK